MKKFLTILCVSLALTSAPAWAKFRGGMSFRPAPVRIAPKPAPAVTPKPTPAVAPKPAPAPVKQVEAPKPAPTVAATSSASTVTQSSSSSFWSGVLPAFMVGWFLSDAFDSDDEEK